MNTKELNDLSVEELQARLVQTKDEYNKLKLQSNVSSIESPIQLRTLRRSVARIATILTQKSSK
ncbi:MAG: 50S ribosomal protein L29 [Flavobacteriales bacterium]|nr:50S ribosomal protein L29 [Flavobacteriales bacterium]